MDAMEPQKPESFYNRLRREIQVLVNELDFSMLRTTSRKIGHRHSHGLSYRFEIKSLEDFERDVIVEANRKSRKEIQREKRVQGSPEGHAAREKKTISVQVSARSVGGPPRKPRDWIKVEDIALDNC
jgi:hypothetical protein